jgi:F-type H+-transporting ATPase subunit b
MSFSWWTFALQAANFLILVWLLQRFLFKPVEAIVAQRKQEISRALNEASAQKQSAEQLKQEVEAARSAIAAERQKVIDDARALLSAEREKTLEETRREADKIREQALTRLEQERASATDKLFDKTMLLATSIAEQLLREIAVASIEQPFLGRVIDYLDKMPAQQRAKLLPRNDASNVSIVTAHALNAREQTQWREELEKRLGAEFTITFDADPALIAGAVITFPHAILNFNWRESLALTMKEIHNNEHPR